MDRIVEPYRPEFGLDEAPKMTYALVGTDMKIYAIDSDEKNMKLNRRSLEKRFQDVSHHSAAARLQECTEYER